MFFSPPLCTIFAPTGVIVERQQKHAKVKNNLIRHSLGFFGILKWQRLEKNRASQKPQITTTCPLFVRICCRCTDSAGPLIKHGQSMALLYLDVNCFRFTGAPHGILPNTSLDLGSGQVRECKAHNVQPTVHSAHTLHIGYATTIHNLLCNVWPETVVVQGFRWRSSFWFFMLSCQSWSKRKKTLNKINLWFFSPQLEPLRWRNWSRKMKHFGTIRHLLEWTSQNSRSSSARHDYLPINQIHQPVSPDGGTCWCCWVGSWALVRFVFVQPAT